MGTSKDDTKYTVRCSRKNSPLGDMAWIAQQHNILHKVGQAKATEELQKYLRGESAAPASTGASARGFGARGAAPATRNAAPAGRTVQADTRSSGGSAPGFDDD